MGLREDIPAKSVGLERAQKPPETAKEPSDSTVSGIKISHPDRLIWPSLGITKRELARYCEAVGEWLGATLPDAKHPDRITIDLDPDPELSWKKLVEATKLTRTLIEGLKLKCFLKTTGGKGLHVVFPLQRRHTWDEAKEFAHSIARFLVKAEPKRFTANMARKNRAGKIFVDYLRNAETASAVSAYSPRARPGAHVSMPLAWDELDNTDIRSAFTVKNIPERLGKTDPWADYAKTCQSITAAMRRALGTE